MKVEEQIDRYIAAHSEPIRTDIAELHRMIIAVQPGCKLWYLDGKNSEGKVVSNPNIGYGSYTMKYADGSSREFYQTGVSSNTAGISVYIMGIEDKKYLTKTFGESIGKATVTGYCIRFKALKDIDKAVLEAAIRSGQEATST